MTKKIYYEKIGKRYVPVRVFDSNFTESYPPGDHLIHCSLVGKSYIYNIDPDFAGLIAASQTAKQSMIDAMSEASRLRPATLPVTQEQQDAWDNLIRVFGRDNFYLYGESLTFIAEAGIKTLQDKAKKLYSNPVVKDAFEQFLVVCKLTEEKNK
jgi:hypothetical protein